MRAIKFLVLNKKGSDAPSRFSKLFPCIHRLFELSVRLERQPFRINGLDVTDKRCPPCRPRLAHCRDEERQPVLGVEKAGEIRAGDISLPGQLIFRRPKGNALPHSKFMCRFARPERVRSPYNAINQVTVCARCGARMVTARV